MVTDVRHLLPPPRPLERSTAVGSGTKMRAWRRSIGNGGRNTETMTNVAMLAVMLQNTACASGSNCRNISASGRRNAMSSGPSRTKPIGR